MLCRSLIHPVAKKHTYKGVVDGVPNPDNLYTPLRYNKLTNMNKINRMKRFLTICSQDSVQDPCHPGLGAGQRNYDLEFRTDTPKRADMT